MGKWQETIGVGFGTGFNRGQKKTTKIYRDDNGRFGGYQIEHWNDRVDADVHVETVKRKVKMEEA